MKFDISFPVVAFMTLTSTVSAAPKATANASTTPSVTQTALNNEQWAGIKSYASVQETKSAWSSVNHVLSTAAVPAATMSKQQDDFRLAALTTSAPELPAYLSDTNSKASAYLSSYYLAQASIIYKGSDNNQEAANSTTAIAQLLPNVTGTKKNTTTTSTTTSNTSSRPTSTVTKPSGSTTKPTSTAAPTTGQDPAIALKSGATGTASSSSSTGAAAMAQSTGVLKMAGVGMLGVVGMAAFL